MSRPSNPESPVPVLRPARRTVLQAGAWALPAVVAGAAVPAHAATSETQRLSIDVRETTRPADSQNVAWGDAVSVVARIESGEGIATAGAAVALSASDLPGLSFSPDAGVTDVDGEFRSTLSSTAGTTFGPATVTAVSRAGSGSMSAFATVRYAGTNVLATGAGDRGGLGTGDAAARRSPSPVYPAFPYRVTKIAQGPDFTLFLTADGDVYAAGSNGSWMLGIGDSTPGFGFDGHTVAVDMDSEVPRRVRGLAHVVDIATGGTFGVALTASGSVYTWGDLSASEGAVGLSLPTRLQRLDGADASPVQVAAGRTTAYALLADGTVRSWSARAAFGQLGDDEAAGSDGVFAGATSTIATVMWKKDSSTIEPLGHVTQISAGAEFACALRDDGTVVAWGAGAGGQLGTGDTPRGRSVAASVGRDPSTPLTGAVQISAGGTSGYAVLDDHTLVAWGDNAAGQLGIGTRASSSWAVDVAVADVREVSGGVSTAHVRDGSGAVFGWGLNATGAVGDGSADGTIVSRPAQLDVQERPILALGVGSGSALRHLVVADPVMDAHGSPRLSLRTADDVVASGSVVEVEGAVLYADGSPVAGQTLQFGATGIGVSFVDDVASGITDARGWARVSLRTTGGYSLGIVALTVAQGSRVARQDIHVVGGNALAVGAMSPWYGLGTGRVGANGVDAAAGAPLVSALEGRIVSAASSWGNSFFVTADGALHAVGADFFRTLERITGYDQSNGFFGVGDPAEIMPYVTTITAFPGFTDARQVVCSRGTIYVLRANGSVVTWGDYAFGAFGDGTVASDLEDDSDPTSYPTGSREDPRPRVIPDLEGVSQLSPMMFGCVALLNDGRVVGWGRNDDNQVTGVSTADQPRPVTIPVPASQQVAGSARSAYALTNDGRVFAWGGNGSGQIGDGSSETRTAPVDVGLTDVRAIVAGESSAYALDGNGDVWAWGANDVGQLGDGSTTDSSSPQRVPGLSGVRQIAATARTAYALCSDGRVLAWGAGEGRGVSGRALSPTLVVGGMTDQDAVPSFSAGGPGTTVLHILRRR